MSIVLVFIASAVALSLLMMVAWLIQRLTDNAGWIDAVWSLSIGLVGVIGALFPFDQPSSRQIMVALLAGIWSLRLGLHIMQRSRRHGDDPRYRQLREEWGDAFPRRLFWFLQIQAVAGLVLVLSLSVAAHKPGALGWQDAVGVALLAAAIVGEALADRQLAQFRANGGSGNRVCDQGLWSRSRHPNYFFEWLAWLAYVPIAINWSGAYPAGWFVLAAPALMYWLLVHVSGIPPLEAHMLRSRGKAFEAYQAHVNAFWPALFITTASHRSNRNTT